MFLQSCPYSPLSIKSPYIRILPTPFKRAAGSRTKLFVYIFVYTHYPTLKISRWPKRKLYGYLIESRRIKVGRSLQQ